MNKNYHDHHYHVDTIHSHCINVKTREIWLHSVDPLDPEEDEPGVEFQTATKLTKNLHILMHESRTEPITIHHHITGGEVYEGLAMYHAIKLMPYKVKMICYTHATSMSGYLLQSADERIMLPDSHFMFHWGEDGFYGDPHAMREYIKLNDKYDEALENIYVNRLKQKGKFSKKTKKWIKEMLLTEMKEKTNVYLTAKEAVEWGFADKILDSF